MVIFHFYFFTKPYLIFLIIPLFHSGITTHKKWLSLFHMIIILLLNVFILLTNRISFLDIWVSILLSLIVINHKMNPIQWLKKYTSKPIVQTKMENLIYRKFFSGTFNQEEFKYLFDKGKLIKTKSKFTFIKEGDKYDKIFFFAQISDTNSVILRRQGFKIQSMEEGGWLGVTDFLYNQKEGIDLDNQKWEVSLACEKENVDICYIEWNAQTIKNIFFYNTDCAFLNKLLLLWNYSLSTTIEKLNHQLSKHVVSKRVVDNNNNNRSLDEETYLLI